MGVNLKGNRLRDSGVQAVIKGLSVSCMVQRLDLSNNRFGKDGAMELAK